MFAAYVGPKTIAYVSQIKRLLEEKGFKGELVFMQSNGGVASADVICENPAALLVSGPAAGPSTAVALAEKHKVKDVVSVDMGGTSFDVCAIPGGQVRVAQMKVVEGMKYCLPSVDVSAIGAGGGSVAWIDPGGRLQVGPQSAGASPGPACYGTGGEEPTVTDADVVLGYIDPDYFLGGETRLRKDLAEKVIKAKIANPLDLRCRKQPLPSMMLSTRRWWGDPPCIQQTGIRSTGVYSLCSRRGGSRSLCKAYGGTRDKKSDHP
jgi:N-methylhydantoinase A